jgi:Fur family peroxide stress response transcriptional regulator
MKALKYSRQRESIKASLMCRHDHPTADALYASIREEFPNISLGTVYRNLNLLVETGEIQKLTCGNGADHFDGDTSEHYHFVCNECGQVYDMDLAPMERLDSEAQKDAPGHIDSHYVLFYGTCNHCLEKKSENGIDKSA